MAGFKVGDQVRLLKLEDWFFEGIEYDAVAFLKSCIGRKTELIGFDEYGHAELVFVRSAPHENYQSHSVWVDKSWIEKV